jgi:putative ABC transport system permease protein
MRRGIIEAISRVDPDVPTATPWTMRDQLGRILAPRRFVAVMLGLFATAALLLAVSGVCTVVSAAAREQASELTIRLALGASRAAMLKTVLVIAGRVLALGIPMGMLLTTVAERLVGDAGLMVDDWRLWTLTPVVLSAAALSASYLRARRVLDLDPAMTLRGD